MDWIASLPPEQQDFVRQLLEMPNGATHLARFADVWRAKLKEQVKPIETLAFEAWKLDPTNPRLRYQTEWIVSRRAPAWQFSMVNDLERNAVYARALEHFIQPEMLVLEIGTGSGLLAMLAARAGARHVYTCEIEPHLAEVARENIARNGLSERITVINKASGDLQPGVDLPEGADLLVSELLDSALLGEHILPVIEDAWARLLKPQALVLPQRIALRGALAGGPQWTAQCRVSEAHGLDISALNRLSPLRVALPGVTVDPEQLLSDPISLFEFDLSSPASYPSAQRSLTLHALRSGQVDGLLHWIAMDFGAGIQYENTAASQSSGWRPILNVFPQPARIEAGQALQVHIEHNRQDFWTWLEG